MYNPLMVGTQETHTQNISRLAFCSCLSKLPKNYGGFRIEIFDTSPIDTARGPITVAIFDTSGGGFSSNHHPLPLCMTINKFAHDTGGRVNEQNGKSEDQNRMWRKELLESGEEICIRSWLF